MKTRTIKCDGEHPDPPCESLVCWRRPESRAPLGAAWITVNLDSAMVRYVLELVNADAARMRALLEHARSRGERQLMFTESTMAKELSEVLLIALSMAVAKNYPVNDSPMVQEIGALSDEDRAVLSDVLQCLHSNAREALIDGVASARTLLTPVDVPTGSRQG